MVGAHEIEGFVEAFNGRIVIRRDGNRMMRGGVLYLIGCHC